MNLLAGELNRLNENDEGVSLYGEQKKFVLKTPKPVDAEPEMAPPTAPPTAPPMAPPSVPSPELPPPPMEDELPDESGEESVPMDDTADMDMGGEEGSDSEENVTFKTIQKLTGKLTQKIRTLDNAEGMTSEDIKYVINMVLSSLDLNSISEEDKEDIMSKFEEDSEDLGGDDMDGEDMTDDTEVEDIQADMDIPMEGEMEENSYGAIIDHIFSESKVDKVISKYFEISKKEILENRDKRVEKNAKKIVEVKRQMKEVIKFSETIEQELASKKFLEENYKAVVVGKTNKNNLVFENNGKQIKISPEGLLV
jgi:hypothetical protein